MSDEHDDGPPPMFHTLDEFVDWLCSWYRRQVDGRAFVWSERWWESAEVVLRMEALWRSWEEARLKPGSEMSAWIRDHADYHMGVVLSPTGPLYRFDFDHSAKVTDGGPLPAGVPPAGMFLPELAEDRQASKEVLDSDGE